MRHIQHFLCKIIIINNPKDRKIYEDMLEAVFLSCVDKTVNVQ